MSDYLLATLANESHLEQARQLFSSAYFNGGWDGDYILLAHDVPDEKLDWFREKNILIQHCPPLYRRLVGGMSPVLTSKFYLFQPEFKRWKVVVYVDADAIIHASLDRLKRVRGFAAVIDADWKTIRQQMILRDMAEAEGASLQEALKVCEQVRLGEEVQSKFVVAKNSFCAGIFAFNTEIIDDQLFHKIKALSDRYECITRYGDQLAFNICFYRQWHRLPPVYNVYLYGDYNQWMLPPGKVPGIIAHHTTSRKPWFPKSFYYREWKESLDRSDNIDLRLKPQCTRRWSVARIRLVSLYLNARYLRLLASRFLSQCISMRMPRFFPQCIPFGTPRCSRKRWPVFFPRSGRLRRLCGLLGSAEFYREWSEYLIWVGTRVVISKWVRLVDRWYFKWSRAWMRVFSRLSGLYAYVVRRRRRVRKILARKWREYKCKAAHLFQSRPVWWQMPWRRKAT